MAFLLGPIGRYLILAVVLAGLWAGVRAHYVAVGRGQVQPALDQAIKDKAALAASLQAKERELKVLNEVRAEYDQNMQSLDTLARDVRRMAGAVSLCDATTTYLPVPGTAPGTDEAGGDGQPRPAEEVLRELDAFIAERSDRQGTAANALRDWLERTRQ